MLSTREIFFSLRKRQSFCRIVHWKKRCPDKRVTLANFNLPRVYVRKSRSCWQSRFERRSTPSPFEFLSLVQSVWFLFIAKSLLSFIFWLPRCPWFPMDTSLFANAVQNLTTNRLIEGNRHHKNLELVNRALIIKIRTTFTFHIAFQLFYVIFWFYQRTRSNSSDEK